MTLTIKTLSVSAAGTLRETSAARSAYGAGILLVCPKTGRVLLGKRSALSPEPGTWAPFGGTGEENEHPFQTAIREQAEESGIHVKEHDLTLLYATNRTGRFPFFTFLAPISEEVEPFIDLTETQASGWFTSDNFPKPLHPGFQELVNSPQWEDVVKILVPWDKHYNQWG